MQGSRPVHESPPHPAAGTDDEHFRVLSGAPRNAMATVLATLRERHGSGEAHLVDEGLVVPEVLTELRARLVEPPAAPH